MTTSCVILNYNDSENTIALMLKIINYKVIDHVIVVDNCSTDDSYTELQRYSFEKVHILRSNRNGGYGYGNNLGIRYAYHELDSKYIVVANPDVDFEEECMKELIETIESNKSCAVVSAVPYTPSGKPQEIIAWKLPKSYEYALSASGQISRYFLINRLFYGLNSFKNDQHLYEVGSVAGALLLIDAEVMIKHGMYDEDIFLYGEETILGIKFKNAGYKTYIRLDQKYIHQHSATINKTFSSTLKKHKILLESHRNILNKYYNVQGIKMGLFNVFFNFTVAEVWCKQLVRRILK